MIGHQRCFKFVSAVFWQSRAGWNISDKFPAQASQEPSPAAATSDLKPF